MNCWIGWNKDVFNPNSLEIDGKRRTRMSGTGMLPRTTLPVFRNWSTQLNSFLNSSSWRWKRLPPTIAHKMLITDRLNFPWKSTTRLGSDWADSLMSLINSWISFNIWSSIDVFPNPKSLRWRKVNRLCSCQNGPSEKISPALLTFEEYQKEIEIKFGANCQNFTQLLSKWATQENRAGRSTVQVVVVQCFFDGVVTHDGNERLSRSHEKSSDTAICFGQILHLLVQWFGFRNR